MRITAGSSGQASHGRRSMRIVAGSSGQASHGRRSMRIMAGSSGQASHARRLGPGTMPRRGQRVVGLAVLGVFALLVLAVPHAEAFVRSRTKSCRPVFWPQTCLYVQPDSELLGDDMPAAAATTAIQNAVQAWNEHLGVSSFMQLRYLPPRGVQEVNPLDGLQLLKFRRDRWCRPKTATTESELCFDQSATAVTTVTFISRPSDPVTDGTIIDADIDFNAVDFHFFDADQGLAPTGGRTPVDLWNTVTHELGHVMGLEHPCRLFPGAIPACVVDGQDNPLPACAEVESGRFMDAQLQTIYESTMYPTSAPGETTKRLPHADDVAGIITTYPQARDPLTCRLPAVVVNAGCAASPLMATHQAAPLFASGVMLALLVRRRRRIA